MTGRHPVVTTGVEYHVSYNTCYTYIGMWDQHPQGETVSCVSSDPDVSLILWTPHEADTGKVGNAKRCSNVSGSGRTLGGNRAHNFHIRVLSVRVHATYRDQLNAGHAHR